MRLSDEEIKEMWRTWIYTDFGTQEEAELLVVKRLSTIAQAQLDKCIQDLRERAEGYLNDIGDQDAYNAFIQTADEWEAVTNQEIHAACGED